MADYRQPRSERIVSKHFPQASAAGLLHMDLPEEVRAIYNVMRYTVYGMIRSFKDKRSKQLWDGETVRAFQAFATVAHRKLDMLDAATELRDLAAPPGHRLEALKGDRAGQHSIRINDQWRICFVWRDGGADQLEIVDYH